ncbi:hypothetical protein [Mariniphaga sediminis]
MHQAPRIQYQVENAHIIFNR